MYSSWLSGAVLGVKVVKLLGRENVFGRKSRGLNSQDLECKPSKVLYIISTVIKGRALRPHI